MTADVIALDPVRLAGLETYLLGLADGCRRRAGRIDDELAGSGLAAPEAVDLLERVATWCASERLDVAWRRAVIEAMDEPLPLTTITMASPAEAREEAGRLAERVTAAMEDPSSRWATLHALMAEVDRRGRDPVFAAAFLTELGSERTRQLPFVLRGRWRTSLPEGPLDPSSEPPPELLADDAAVLDLVRHASQATGPDALTDGWLWGYMNRPASVDEGAPASPARPRGEAAPAPTVDEVELALTGAGYGSSLVERLVAWYGAGRVAAVVGTGGAVVGIVTAPWALDDGDGAECDVPQAALGLAAGVVGLFATVTGGPVGLGLLSMALGAGSAVFTACQRQPAQPNETTYRNDENGQPRLPSGSQSNAHVDEAGVPLPPAG